MSLDATLWAWKAPVQTSTQRLVLISLADRAGEDHTCFPSYERLTKDTLLNRKTIVKVISELIGLQLIQDTGERKGVTRQVKVYRLTGVIGREETVPKTEQSQKRNSSNIGTLNSPKNGTLNSPNIGTQNLSSNLPIEPINIKNWFSFKKLKTELSFVTDSDTAEKIGKASWFEREKNAFEQFNADKNLNDSMKMYYFVDWLLKNMSKYEKPISSTNTKSKASHQKTMTEKQIHVFAQKLSHLPEIASKYAEGNESYEQLAAKIAKKLSNPTECKKLEPYLREIGFTGAINA
ncbi:helix-turn-helix domain-containing protein [Acinetobacter pollinis]|uniref:helix-turn-helix domain-containing protein n=1 Tax=Acinetobacter pollinis TaxID=2605270 RepID=UPI0018A26D09|nr:helix-turn-helix domain-containing protein [Acinetobacter pollinis]MBF7690848.1 helix-turn-helix domain-containing protein [Acinetobacter pollinis]MBF7698493.1 helix-turn-helix domain-containing protein [Acinetobacter pollinis]